jgi:apolipoprotein D and lipocalin family protein
MNRLAKVFTMSIVSLLGACRSTHPPITTEPNLDLQRFMGDWYVIANIPTSLERGAHNAVESYRLDPDGTIATTFTFRDGSFDGKVKTYHPRGFVRDERSNSVWGMRFIWPIKADYRVVYVSEDYQLTIVGREKRDNVWIMARTPQISEQQFEDLKSRVAREGYDVALLQRVPQHWPDQPASQ